MWPLRSSSLCYTNLFFRPFSFRLHSVGFLSDGNFTKLEHLHRAAASFPIPLLQFLLCPCPSVLPSVFPFTSNSGRTVFYLLFYYQATMGPESSNIRFSRETMRLMSWPDGERYSCSLQFLVVSLLSYLLLSFLGVEVYRLM